MAIGYGSKVPNYEIAKLKQFWLIRKSPKKLVIYKHTKFSKCYATPCNKIKPTQFQYMCTVNVLFPRDYGKSISRLNLSIFSQFLTSKNSVTMLFYAFPSFNHLGALTFV